MRCPEPPEYNVFWDDSGETEYDEWVTRAEAEARLNEIYSNPKQVEAEYDIAPEELKDTVFLVRRWRVEYLDDDWDYLNDEQAEYDVDDERRLTDDMRLAGF